MSIESSLREDMRRYAASLFARGFTVGSSGNISVRLDDGILITPANLCLAISIPPK